MNSCSVAVVGCREATLQEDFTTRSTERTPCTVSGPPEPHRPSESCAAEDLNCKRSMPWSGIFMDILSLNCLFLLHYVGCCGRNAKNQNSNPGPYNKYLWRSKNQNKTNTSSSRRTVEASPSSPWKSSRVTKVMKKTTNFQQSWSSDNTHMNSSL